MNLAPLAGEEVAQADDQRHEACQRVAVPEALTAHTHGKAQQRSNAHAADHAVDQRHGKVELGVAAAVDEREAHAAGGGAVEVEDGRRHQNGGNRQHVGVRGEHVEDLLREEQHGHSAGGGYNQAAHQHRAHDDGHALVLLCAQVLPHHAAAGGGEGVRYDADHHVHLVVDAAERGVHHAVQVDPGGEHDLGDVDGRRLDGHGHAQRHQLAQSGLIDGKAGQLEIEGKAFLVAVEVGDGKNEAGCLRDDRCQCGAEHFHAHSGHQHQIQNQVEHRRNGNEHEGTSAVAHAAQDGADDVVAVNEHQTYQTGDGIIHGVLIGFGRGVEDVQHPVADEEAAHGNQQRDAQQEGKHGTDGMLHIVHAARAHIARHQHLTGRGEAHGHKGEQMQHIAADGNGAHTCAPNELADNDHVHNVVNRL